MMRDVNRTNGTTFFMVTHNMELAHRCDRIVELVDGRLVPLIRSDSGSALKSATARPLHPRRREQGSWRGTGALGT